MMKKYTPYQRQEILARAKAILKRTKKQPQKRTAAGSGDLVYKTKGVTWRGRVVK
jgi:DNA-binding response OmpR family regulator